MTDVAVDSSSGQSSESSPVSLDALKENLQQQVAASNAVLEVVDQLTAAAKSSSDTSAGPGIGPQLQKLAQISKDLSQSAGSVAQTVATNLSKVGR